ncbi:MAG: glycosyltransferase family 2 protein [Deltaproteobacteria bacterium]|nr:glycosyltransferase family 2 protein [Deltaproteobacteria bacterium]
MTRTDDHIDSSHAYDLPESVRRGVYIVIAAFNEESTIGDVVRGLKPDFPHVVVVDDGSLDNTWVKARQAGAETLQHVINRGQGAALQTGIEYSLRQGAKQIVTFDADGQHSVRSIPNLLAPILRGRAEIVLGSRFLDDSGSVPFGRRLLLAAAVLFTWLTSGARLSDTHNGMRAFSREAAAMLDIQLDRMAHASEIIDQVVRSGLAYTEVPVQINYTEYSRAKGQRAAGSFRVLFDYFIGRLLR